MLQLTKLPKRGSTQRSIEVSTLELQLARKEENRIKIREIKPTTTHTSKKLPKLVFVFDTEATIKEDENGNQLQTLRFGYGLFSRYYPTGRVYESNYVRFENGEQLYNLLAGYSRQGSKLYCFAHNLGYDWSLTGIHKSFEREGWGTHSIADRKGSTIVKYTRGKHTIIFIDTLNYFKLPLAQLAIDFGLEKGSVDFRHSETKELEDYCKNDVYILNEVLSQWRELLEKNNYGAWKPTLASQALAILKQLYLTAPIKTSQGANQKLLERKAYYGGRTEANYIGFFQGKVWNLDINSAYPSVMRDNKFPVEFIKECRNPTTAQIRDIDDKCCVFAEVTIDSDKAFYPRREGEYLIFPVGEFRTWLCEPELRLALEYRHIRKIHRLFVYKARPLFTDYVNALYRKRREAISNGNTALSLSYKLLLNGLYGKFGERKSEWTPKRVSDRLEDGVEYVGDLDTKEMKKTIHYGGLQYEYTKAEGAAHSFPLISAFATSYLRVKLVRAMERVGRHNWIYCDTDSLYVTDEGRRLMSDMIDNEKIGRWKVEKIGINMDIRGLKDYVFAGEDKVKGIPHDAEKLDDNTYKMLRWQSMHKTICENLHGSVTIEPMVKHLDRVYHKGIPTPSGWVDPIVIIEFT
jgi:hypothetical protein